MIEADDKEKQAGAFYSAKCQEEHLDEKYIMMESAEERLPSTFIRKPGILSVKMFLL